MIELIPGANSLHFECPATQLRNYFLLTIDLGAEHTSITIEDYVHLSVPGARLYLL